MIPLDLKRILDHEVEMFGLELPAVWQVIREFAKYCDHFSSQQGDVQVASEEELRTLREDNPYTFYVAREHPALSSEIALTNLLRRPRVLKHALRRTWLAWQSLHGEVSLDDLLIYSTIHTVNSEAVAYMRDNWATLAETPDRNRDRRSEADLQAVWDAHLGATSDAEKRWLWTLVKSLFPDIGGHSNKLKVQGADQERYWSRITNGQIEARVIRDQRVILDMSRWRASGASAVVAQLMADGQYSDIFERLLRRVRSSVVGLKARDLLTLASALFERMRSTLGVGAYADRCPGFFALWRLEGRARRFAGYEEWLWAEIEKTLPISLRFHVDIEYYWGSIKYMPLDQAGRVRIRHKVADWAKANVTADFLCRVLPPEVPHILRLFVIGPSNETETPEPDWQAWSWIADVLLESLQRDSLLMIPQTVTLLIGSEQHLISRLADEQDELDPHAQVETKSWIKEDWLNALFPDTVRRRQFAHAILQIVSNEDTWPMETQTLVRQVRHGLSHSP